MDDDKSAEILRELLKTMSDTSGAASSVKDKFVELLKVTDKSINAREKETATIRDAETQAKLRGDSYKSLAKSAVDTAQGFTNITSSLYGATGAFTSLIPSLNLMSNIAQNVVSAFGTMLSNISVVGVSFGKVPEGVAKALNTSIDLFTKVAEFQLASAQKMVGMFYELVSVGATFGGSMKQMQLSAAEAGLDVLTFNKVIRSNTSTLAMMSEGMVGGAIAVGKLGTQLAASSPKLLAITGTFESLDNMILEYIDLQQRLGINTTKDQNALREGAKEYIFQQRELAALTGRRADELKKEEEERRKIAAYQLALAKMTDEGARSNARMMVSVFKTFGPDVEKAVMEHVIGLQTGNMVFSETTQKFRAFGGPLVDMMEQTLGNLNMMPQDFQKSLTNMLATGKPILEAYVKDANQAFMAQIQYAGLASDSVFNIVSRATSGILGMLPSLEGMPARVDQAFLDRMKPISDETKAYLEAEKKRLEGQKTIDAMILTNMTNMSGLVERLTTVQKAFLSASSEMSEAMSALANLDTKAFVKAITDLTGHIQKSIGINLEQMTDAAKKETSAQRDRLASQIVETLGPTAIKIASAAAGMTAGASVGALGGPLAPVTVPMGAFLGAAGGFTGMSRFADWLGKKAEESSASLLSPPSSSLRPGEVSGRISNLQQKALGGIVNKPSIAGEAGPEAVVPLPDGRTIPVNIDLNPMISALNEQIRLARETLDELKDTKSVQEKILMASY